MSGGNQKTPAAHFATVGLRYRPGSETMSGDQWSARVYDLPCAGCGQISHKSFIELETEDRLPCDHCGVSIKMTDYYGTAELDAIAKSRSGKFIPDCRAFAASGGLMQAAEMPAHCG